MKVICINNKNPIEAHRLLPKNWIYEGEVYTVTSERFHAGNIFYRLAEREFGAETAQYQSNRFIPLSQIDETDMIRYVEEKREKMLNKELSMLPEVKQKRLSLV